MRGDSTLAVAVINPWVCGSRKTEGKASPAGWEKEGRMTKHKLQNKETFKIKQKASGKNVKSPC